MVDALVGIQLKIKDSSLQEMLLATLSVVNARAPLYTSQIITVSSGPVPMSDCCFCEFITAIAVSQLGGGVLQSFSLCAAFSSFATPYSTSLS